MDNRRIAAAITTHSTDQELMDAFAAGNHAAEGFGPGEPTDTPSEAADREQYVILRDIWDGTNTPGEPVFCQDGDDLIVIANCVSNGPWAVTVGKVVA